MGLKSQGRRPLITNLFLAIMSAFGVLLVLLATSRYGPGLSPDSVGYIGTARNLMSGHGYVSYGDGVFALWTPLFPTLLAALGLLGIDPLDGARYINAVAFGLIILFSGQLFLLHIRSRALAILGTLAAFSSALFAVSVTAWSEPVFVLLTILFTLYLSRFVDRLTICRLLVLSSLAALACLQRYMGVTLVIAGLLAITLYARSSSLLSRLKRATVFGVLAGVPLAVWMARNYVLTGTFAGSMPPSPYTYPENLLSAVAVLVAWFIPDSAPAPLRIATIVLLALLALLALISLHRNRKNTTATNGKKNAGLLMVTVLTYFGLLQIGAAFHSGDLINYRHLVPIYVLVMCLAFIALEDISNWFHDLPRGRLLRIVDTMVIILVSLWLIGYPLRSVFAQTVARLQAGASGYNSIAWRESPTVKWLQSLSLDGQIYSNAPDAIYILTDEINAHFVPRETSGMLRFAESIRSDRSTYLAWFNRSHRQGSDDDLSYISQLSSLLTVREVAVFPDGGIYTLTPRDRLPSLPADAIPTEISYENGSKLIGYRLDPVVFGEEKKGLLQPLALYWERERPCSQDYRVGVKLANSAATIWATEYIRPPCKGGPDDPILVDEIEMQVLPGTPPGSYDVEVIMLRLRDGRELPPTDGSEVLLGPIEIPVHLELTVESLDIEHLINAKLSEQVRFLGYNVAGGTNPGEQLHFTAFWECLAPMDESYKVFVHVVDQQGNLLDQKDTEPVDGFYPTNRWQVGQIIRDQYDIPFLDDSGVTASGLRVGMYSPGTGERLPVVLANGEMPEDRAISIP